MNPLRRVAACAACALLASTGISMGALAAEGGGNGCPWAQDLTLELGYKSITVPQTIFAPNSPGLSVDGYELSPDLNALSLRIVDPRGEVWQAALTRLAGGKRCTVFYVGRPTRVESRDDTDHVTVR
ncbi:MAG TPA: hypothetical protein VD978_30390 [Azospirillum sp.]|nr:hypothetical protein [Azospirillum sp.]